MLKTYASSIWAQLRRDPVLLALLLLSAAYFMLTYITNPIKSNGPNTGWFTFYDQGQYLRMAHTLADFNFQQLHQTYSYGVGYPLVAVPLLWLGYEADPFILFNLIAFVLITYATYRAAKWLISPFAGFLAGFGLVFATPLIDYTNQPWNSTVCLIAMSAILITITIKHVTKWHALVLGLSLGWVFAARYVDILWLGPLMLATMYRGSFKLLARHTAFLILGFSLFALPVLYSHDRIFGSPFKTPYVNHLGINGVDGSDQGLAAYNIERAPRAAVALFVSPILAGGTDGDRGLFIHMFWGFMAVPGAYILFKRGKHTLFLASAIGLAIVASLFYLSFRASTVGSLKYGELHYFKMFWPGLVILAVAFFDSLFAKTVALETAAAVVKPVRSTKAIKTSLAKRPAKTAKSVKVKRA